MSNRIASIQLCSTTRVDDNLTTLDQLVANAQQQGAKIAVLPEMFALCAESATIKIQEPFDRGPIQNRIKEMAIRHQIWIIAGTIPLISEDPKRPTASTLVIDQHGGVQARYDKIHLFDAQLSKKEQYQESAHTLAGNQPVVCDTPAGKVGLSVCYDLRFPELFRCLQQQGAQILVISAAFLHTTGQHHWHVLLRARAIENSCYVIAANQCGQHESGRRSFGHSMIIDPWGEIIVSATQQEEAISADISQQQIKKIRSNTPFTQHQTISYSPQ